LIDLVGVELLEGVSLGVEGPSEEESPDPELIVEVETFLREGGEVETLLLLLPLPSLSLFDIRSLSSSS